ncbi:UDP-N-acetylglucosamine 4,6-dehydratase family protein [Parabacteroides goldsteinii]|uniref:UDP-N-acetylglucosamine 4,6-dehydratase family protein n=1 Tax=Parabacteroides goldsteinii TaxID=328812 RepID=UPI001D48426A|nr:nucleoside-diphosphate sugar epimerase/dehydratase [Parabacteroides goldsteinii]MBS6577934.1 polysaccharide biosynthesis protein [Parabacteroides goldsteinii]
MLKINDFIILFSKQKYFNRWVIFFIDLFFSVLSTFLVFATLGNILKISLPVREFIYINLFSILCSTICFLSCQTYKGVIRHSTFTETGRIAIASFVKATLMIVALSCFIHSLSFLQIFLGGLLDLFLTFFILTTFRALLIMMYSMIVRSIASNNEKLLIYREEGTSSSSSVISLWKQSDSCQIGGYIRIGERSKIRIGGYPVYSVKNQMEFNALVDQKGIKTILFTDYHVVKAESERLVRYCEKKKIRMLVFSAMNELKSRTVNLHNLPEIRIEDLLGRDEININLKKIAGELKGKVTLVTGAAGSIGSELCRQLCKLGLKQLILFDSAETPMHTLRLELEDRYPEVVFTPIMGDVRMLARVESVFKRFHPQYVFHAAAYKHVPLMEENPCEAVHTNVQGTCNMADMSVKYDVDKFIMISTDKAVNPTNVMGASKRLAEIYVQSLSIAINKGIHLGKTRFITTRFGNVLGSNGSVIPRFRDQLAKGGPLTVTHPDIIRYFMTIPEACRLVLEAAFMGEGNEIFVFDMGTPVKIADLARRMIELVGLIPDKDIEIKYTGLRPGEKLYEELLATKENTLPTINAKIFRAKVREYDFAEISAGIDHLIDLAIRVEKLETVKMMKSIVPEFISRNSEYEKLDK